jgi:tetratricopeptide (TPR) repeat protein
MRFVALGALGASAGKATGTLTSYEYIINIVPLLFEYLKLLVWPSNLIFYAHMRWETVGSITDGRSVILLIVSAYVLYSLWRFKKKAPTVIIAVVWMALPLVPIIASGFMKGFPLFAERYLYLSSAGYALLIAYVAVLIYNATGQKRQVAVIIVAAFVVATVAFSAATIARNSVWATPFTLWSDTAKKAPYVVDARVNHANELSKQERLDEAMTEYKAALRLDPQRASTHNGLGILYGKRGLLKEAALEFETALALNPDSDERAAIRKNLTMANEMLIREGVAKDGEAR